MSVGEARRGSLKSNTGSGLGTAANEPTGEQALGSDPLCPKPLRACPKLPAVLRSATSDLLDIVPFELDREQEL